LSDEALQMAKEIGLDPQRLIKSIPNPSEPWKAPVETWVRDIYRKTKEKTADRKARREADGEEWTLAESGVEMEIERYGREAAAGAVYR